MSDSRGGASDPGTGADQHGQTRPVAQARKRTWNREELTFSRLMMRNSTAYHTEATDASGRQNLRNPWRRYLQKRVRAVIWGPLAPAGGTTAAVLPTGAVSPPLTTQPGHACHVSCLCNTSRAIQKHPKKEKGTSKRPGRRPQTGHVGRAQTSRGVRGVHRRSHGM